MISTKLRVFSNWFRLGLVVGMYSDAIDVIFVDFGSVVIDLFNFLIILKIIKN